MEMTHRKHQDREGQDPQAVALINALGGSVAVSRLCDLTHGAVSQWKRNGIPRSWVLYFREKYPDNFDADGRVIAHAMALET